MSNLAIRLVQAVKEGRLLSGVARRIKELAPLPHDVVVTMQDGCRVRLHPAVDSHEARMFKHRTYEPATLALLDAAVRSTDVVVDVGANIGTICLHAALLASRVIAIEPHPIYCRRLQENVVLNAATNVEIIRFAAGSSAGAATIYDVPSVNIGRSSLIDPGPEGVPFGSVEVRPLDDLLNTAAVGPVRFLKIDVEGFEADVIAGAAETLRTAPIVCMEFEPSHAGGRAFDAHDAIMRSNPYRCYIFRDTKFSVSPLIETSREALQRVEFNNAVYMTDEVRRNLPSSLFA